MKPEAIVFAIIIIGSLVSYYVFKLPIWVASAIIASGLLFLLLKMFKKKK